MKKTLGLILAGTLILVSPHVTLAGMNHQPHNVKKFMGVERKAKVEISEPQSSANGDRQFAIRKSLHQKGVDRVLKKDQK